jgi:hypothetical protein
MNLEKFTQILKVKQVESGPGSQTLDAKPGPENWYGTDHTDPATDPQH